MKTRKRHPRYRLRRTRGAGKHSRNSRNLFLNIETSNNDTNGLGNALRPSFRRKVKEVYIAKDSVFDTDDIRTRGIVPFLHDCEYIQHSIGKGTQAISHVIQHPMYGTFLLRIVTSSSMSEVANEIELYKRIHSVEGHEKYVSQLLYADIPKTDIGVGMSYFLFEFKEGKSLQQFFRVKPVLTFEEAQMLLSHMIHCIQFLHSIQIIHRDIKPANFYVPEGSLRPLIFDFGVSCLSNISCTSHEFVGSREYAHPEATEAFRIPGKSYTFDTDYDMYAVRMIGIKDIMPLVPNPDLWKEWVEEQFSTSLLE
jgi:serine/threonine protein kinase